MSDILLSSSFTIIILAWNKFLSKIFKLASKLWNDFLGKSGTSYQNFYDKHNIFGWLPSKTILDIET